MNLEQEFKELLEDTLEGLGRDVETDLDAIANYMVERTEHLSDSVGEPGFNEAVLAERDNIILAAGILITKEGDRADQRIAGVITGAIRIAAVALRT